MSQVALCLIEGKHLQVSDTRTVAKPLSFTSGVSTVYLHVFINISCFYPLFKISPETFIHFSFVWNTSIHQPNVFERIFLTTKALMSILLGIFMIPLDQIDVDERFINKASLVQNSVKTILYSYLPLGDHIRLR